MNKKLLFTILGVLFLGAAVVFGIQLIKGVYAPRVTATASAAAPIAAPGQSTAGQDGAGQAPAASPGQAEDAPAEEQPEAAPYESPIDFAYLQSVNPDIYAWLEIPDTEISFPVVQDPASDTFYLNHNSDRAYSANGAVFSEPSYNSGDLTDPVTVLYGHHMWSGAMFGNLEKYYTDSTYFDEHPTFTIYTPDAALTYGVFAAVPYTSQHILNENDFDDDTVFENFFSAVFNTRDLSARFRVDYAPQAGDRVVILSTCLTVNNSRRFLVMAKLLA